MISVADFLSGLGSDDDKIEFELFSGSIPQSIIRQARQLLPFTANVEWHFEATFVF